MSLSVRPAIPDKYDGDGGVDQEDEAGKRSCDYARVDAVGAKIAMKGWYPVWRRGDEMRVLRQCCGNAVTVALW